VEYSGTVKAAWSINFLPVRSELHNVAGWLFIGADNALNRETLASYLLFNCGGFAAGCRKRRHNILKVTVGQADSQYQGK
jgi:hypothetical protein